MEHDGGDDDVVRPDFQALEFIPAKDLRPNKGAIRVAGIIALVPLLLLGSWGMWAALTADEARSRSGRFTANTEQPPTATHQAEKMPKAETSVPTAGPSLTSTPSSRPVPPADKQSLAESVDKVLQESHGTRQQVLTAVQDATACGPGLESDTDKRNLTQAADIRRRLADKAETLSLDSLPGGIDTSRSLVTMLRESAKADDEFADWVADLGGACNPETADNNPHLNAATATSKQATAAKGTLLASWNPVAQQYGLTVWKETDL